MSGNKITVTIDGKKIDVIDGQTILQAFLSAGIQLPHICYNEALGPLSSCDTCLVEVNGKIKRACSTRLTEGSNILSKSSRLNDLHVESTQKILRNHDMYCTVCENSNGDCSLHNTVHDLNINFQKYPFSRKGYDVDNTNPFYIYDPDQCILCGRCVEACQDVEVNETIHIDWSLDRPRVIWDNGASINNSSCVSCGHCVTVCPVNALMEKGMLGKAGYLTGLPAAAKSRMIEVVKSLEPEIGMKPVMAISNIEAKLRNSRIKKTKTVCTYCGVGCSFDIWTVGREILKVQPQTISPANGISTCIKGKFGWDFVNSGERLTTPLIRDKEGFRKASWEEALDYAASRLYEIKGKYDGDAIEFIASSKGTNEEAYLMQKLARQVFGTNNVDNSSRFCQAPATTGLWRTVGYGGDAGSIHDIYMADLVLAIGTNTAEAHPVIAARVKRAHKLNGQKLIVADLREHEMARRADIFIHPKPGTDIVWINALSRYIIDMGWMDSTFISTRTNMFDEYRKSLDPFTLEFSETTTGIRREDLIKIAESIHNAKNVVALWAMGVTQQQTGSDTSTAISNLLLVTGNYGRMGTGAYPLRGHNNVQGASDFGAMPGFLPGYQSLDDKEIKKRFERAWNCKIPATSGYDNNTCLEAIHDDGIRAMYIIGEELAETGSGSTYVREQLEKLEFLVVQDMFLSETAKYADVVLPSSASLEKEGTFVNTERRIQRIYQVMRPLDGTRPDWEIIQDIANRLDAGWSYSHPKEIMDEVALLAPIFAGVNYDRLQGYNSLQWPVSGEGKDSPFLYAERFNFKDGKARFYPVKWERNLKLDKKYDLHLNNGRLLEHFHEGNETYKTPGIKAQVPGTFIEISPELSAERNLITGDKVRIISKWGSGKATVLVTDRVTGHELYLPMNGTGEESVNRLTSRLMDPATHTPSYKQLSVRIEKIEEDRGENPLPDNNHRYANPVPQKGINIEAKWKRGDYHDPTQG
ncbi:MAG: formate dehydrogenase subunit alpha [Candidatus Thermoplasmatota archaeon]|nr:formate dehydrogenase subunit alpha [Candidatus Thermoplasmatota archaeon]